MIKLKLPSVFVLVSIAAAVSGCTVCVDCEPQSARTTAPLGKKGNTYYYSDSWTEPRRQVSRPAVSTSYYSSSVPVISTPVTSYRPVTQQTWRTTARPAASFSSSYYSYPQSYQYAYQQRPAASMSRQYAYWPYNSPPELPSAAWQGRYIGQAPRTMYYYPPVNSYTNSNRSGALRRYRSSSASASSGGSPPVYLGPVWYYP